MKTAIWRRAYAYHVCKFMGDYSCNSLLVSSRGSERVVEQRRLPVCDQTPVLHRTGMEVRQSNLIWRKERKSECLSERVQRGTWELEFCSE